MGARQSKRPSRPRRPRAYVRFDDFEILRAIGRGAFGKARKNSDGTTIENQFKIVVSGLPRREEGVEEGLRDEVREQGGLPQAESRRQRRR